MTLTKEWAETVGPVIRWAKKEGWHRTRGGMIYGRRGVVNLSVDVTRINGAHYYGLRSSPLPWLEPKSAQQAIDVLAALGVIPARFSSQWREGRDVALEAVAAAVLLPDLEPVPEFVDGYHVGSRA